MSDLVSITNTNFYVLIPSYKPSIKILEIRNYGKFFGSPHLELIRENLNISVGFTGPIRPNFLGPFPMNYGSICDQNYDLIMGH